MDGLVSLKTEPQEDDLGGSKKTKITRRNKQKHNETERKRREHLTQLFEDMKKELREEQEAEGEEPAEMENRNAVLEQALLCLRRLKVKASASARPSHQDKFDEIPGLRSLVDYVDYLNMQLSRKRKLSSDSAPPTTTASKVHIRNTTSGKPVASPTEFVSTTPPQHAGQYLDPNSSLYFAHDLDYGNSNLSPYDSSSLDSPTSVSDASSSSPESYSLNDAYYSSHFDGESESHNLTSLPQQPTTVVDFGRMLFSVLFFFGLFYSWRSDPSSVTQTAGAHIGRMLQEHSPTITSVPGFFSNFKEILFMWLLWNPMLAFMVLLLCYVVILVMSEPVMAPSTHFYQQAEKEYRRALSAGSIESCEKHYLNALAFLGRAFPSGFQLRLAILFQFVRYILHCMWVGVWLDKLLLFTRGGQASHKQAADLYLSLIRNCHGRIQGADLIYLSLCTINISQLFDPIWVAETYAHVSFFLEYRFPHLKMPASFFLQLAWRIAKSENNSRLVWLLYATSHLHMRKGNWKDAETYLRHIKDKLSKLQQTLGGRALPTSAQTLIRYTTLTKANLELGKGHITKGFSLVKELERMCSVAGEKKNGLSSSRTPAYVDPVCARLAMIIEATCLLRTNRAKEAEDVLNDLRRLNDEVSDAPSGAMEEVAREGLWSKLYLLSGDIKMAIAAADKALLLAQNQNGQQLFVWPAYTTFVETHLAVWEKLLKEKVVGSATDYLLPTSDAWETDEDGRPKVELGGEAGQRLVLKHLETKVREGIAVLERNAEYMSIISPTILRFKGQKTWIEAAGDSKKEKAATALWELSLQKAKELGMAFEEARVMLEIGKSMMANKCRCLIKRRHNVSCAIHYLELANQLFIKCGALLNSQQAIELIETHHKQSSIAISKSFSQEVLLTSEDATTSSLAPSSIYEVLSTQDTVV